MTINWFSEKGYERNTNNDFAAIKYRDGNIFAVLVDGSEKGPNGDKLAKYWAEITLNALECYEDNTSIVNRLEAEQKNLRNFFLHDTASYCMMNLNTQSKKIKIWHCGDCLVGLKREEETKFLTSPHILSRQPGITLTGNIEEDKRKKNTLTSVLESKRFHIPEFTDYNLTNTNYTLFICSDGYWQTFDLNTDIIPILHEDDASQLSITPNKSEYTEVLQQTDSNNFLHFVT